MDNELKEAISRADHYIKTEDYGLAWKTLRPYQDYPEAQKRIVWLKKKHAQLKREKAAQQITPPRPRKRIWPIAAVGVVVVALLLVVLLASNPGAPQQNGGEGTPALNASPNAGNGVDVAQAATATAEAIIHTSPTAAITENPHEMTLQDEAKQRVGALAGVDTIKTLDIDVPTDEAPVVYVEIQVIPGNNNTTFVGSIMTTLNEVLNVTQYSDFDVIVSDGSQTIEYIFDAQSNSWTSNRIN